VLTVDQPAKDLSRCPNVSGYRHSMLSNVNAVINDGSRTSF
jgi:hypothetical protein